MALGAVSLGTYAIIAPPYVRILLPILSRAIGNFCLMVTEITILQVKERRVKQLFYLGYILYWVNEPQQEIVLPLIP